MSLSAARPGLRVRAALGFVGTWLAYRLDRSRREALILELLAPGQELSAQELRRLSRGRLGENVDRDLTRLEAAGQVLTRLAPPLGAYKLYRLRGARRKAPAAPATARPGGPALGAA